VGRGCGRGEVRGDPGEARGQAEQGAIERAALVFGFGFGERRTLLPSRAHLGVFVSTRTVDATLPGSKVTSESKKIPAPMPRMKAPATKALVAEDMPPAGGGGSPPGAAPRGGGGRGGAAQGAERGRSRCAPGGPAGRGSGDHSAATRSAEGRPAAGAGRGARRRGAGAGAHRGLQLAWSVESVAADRIGARNREDVIERRERARRERAR
jgi:hypothetical protein